MKFPELLQTDQKISITQHFHFTKVKPPYTLNTINTHTKKKTDKSL